MRFELFLEKLPRASNERVMLAVADLPSGLSTGVLKRAVTERIIPTVSVAFSDDKRVINEIEDTLIELGAEVRVDDHGHLFQRLATFLRERFGQRQYLEDEVREPHALVKLWFPSESDSLATKVTSHLLRCVVQCMIAGLLLVWTRGLGVGLSNLISGPSWLFPQLLACALGVTVGYASIEGHQAYRAGKLPKRLAIALASGLAAVSLAAILFVEFGAKSAEALHVTQPPSNPYAGLLTELRRRQEAHELPADDSAKAEKQEQQAKLEDAVLCSPSHMVDGPMCAVDATWSVALACLPAPETPLAIATKLEADEEPEELLAAPVTAPIKTARVAAPWSVRFELVHLMSLFALWLGCLLAAQLLFQRHLTRTTGAAAKSNEDTLRAELEKTSAALAAATAATSNPTSSQDNTLQEELSKAQSELSKAHAREEALRDDLKQAKGSPQAGSDALQLAKLQNDLGMSRAALAALQEQSAVSKTLAANQAAEIMRLNVELNELSDQLQRANAQRAQALDVPANDQGSQTRENVVRNQGSLSSYSVSGSQEERVAPRRRG